MTFHFLLGLLSGLGLSFILLLLYALCRAAADLESVPDGNEEHL